MLKYIMRQIKKFKSWLRFNPPGALTADGWIYFNKEFKKKAPVRYWLYNDFKKKLNPIRWKYESIVDWIRYRTVCRYHIIDIGQPPGFYEYDSQILYANFSILTKYVETGLAWRSYWTEENKDKNYWKRQYVPFYNLFVPLVRPDIGIKHLEWEMSLDDPTLPPHDRSPDQARRAREVHKLYVWWKEVRPARKNLEIRRPLEIDDDNIFSTLSSKFKSTPGYKKYMSDLDKQHRLEERWRKEDDAMLIRLMKIRRGLWT